MTRIGIVLAILTLCVAAASGAAQKKKKAVDIARPQFTRAVCMLYPKAGSKVTGRVVFTQKDGFIEITGEVTGLKPGEHGFHVHEYGDCSDADGKCAGGHFNPTGAPHGGRDAEQRHDGDLGNIKADDDGKAVINFQDRVLRLNGPRSILGRGLVVHADPDDLKTQPTGNAGARVALGVIGIGMPEEQHK